MSPQPQRPNSHDAFKPRREEIEFAPNIPITVSIRYNLPKTVSGMSGERAMYSTPENKVFFLPLDVAGQISELGIQPNQPFTICKRSSGKHGAPVTWEIQPQAKSQSVSQLGPQSDGTFAIPNDAPRDEDAPPAMPARKGVQSARTLVDEANALVDAYATVLDRALKTHQGRVKPDEVRALLITSYIQRGKQVA